jgi:hypothetical protein
MLIPGININHEEYCVDYMVATTSCRGSSISLLHVKEALFTDVRGRPLTLKSQRELGVSGKAQGQGHHQNKGPHHVVAKGRPDFSNDLAQVLYLV